MKMKNKRTINAKQLLSCAFAVLMLVGGIIRAYAEEKRGTVITKASSDIFLNVTLFIDTTGNSVPDHTIAYTQSLTQTPIGALLDSLLEKGATVSFDDEKAFPFSGFPTTSHASLLDINGVSILTWFPGCEHLFPYAAKKAERTAAAHPATPALPAPATQETAEERRIRELEEELRRLRESR